MTVKEINEKLYDLGYVEVHICDENRGYGWYDNGGMFTIGAREGTWLTFKSPLESARSIEKVYGIKII